MGLCQLPQPMRLCDTSCTRMPIGMAHRRCTGASTYHPHDRVRLIRALEVLYLTGEPFSLHRYRHQGQAPLFSYIGVGLTRERTDLYTRITTRTDAMLAAGWLAEVERLVGWGYTRA